MPISCATKDAEVGVCILLKIKLNEDLTIQNMKGSFEVLINETLVHSKLASLAFPAADDVIENVKNAQDGRPVTKCREEPIKDCVIQ